MTEPIIFPTDESNQYARFSRVYSGVPLGERKNVIVIIEKKPINWEMADREIKQNTELGKKIADKLIKLGVI